MSATSHKVDSQVVHRLTPSYMGVTQGAHRLLMLQQLLCQAPVDLEAADDGGLGAHPGAPVTLKHLQLAAAQAGHCVMAMAQVGSEGLSECAAGAWCGVEQPGRVAGTCMHWCLWV